MNAASAADFPLRRNAANRFPVPSFALRAM